MSTQTSRRWSRASLRIWSKTTTAQEIAAALGVPPTKSHVMGEQVGSREYIRRRDHFYSWSPDIGDDNPLDVHLRLICDRFEALAQAIRALPDCSANIFCGYSSENGQGGTTLTPELLGRIAAMGFALVLDLYPPSANETASES